MLIDNHQRKINYLRLGVTDRCNLRCFYCMPEEGIAFMKKQHLMSYEEMLRLVSVLGKEGIDKVRITGGEPFVRRDMLYFLRELRKIPTLRQLSITTNGTLTADKVDELAEIGIQGINLSLDSLDPQRFAEITRRDSFAAVWQTLEAILQTPIRLKINMVVMQGRNIEDILPMVELARHHELEVRLIEEMPFNGTAGQGNPTFWPVPKMQDHIRQHYPLYRLKDEPAATAATYQIPGFRGRLGFIAAFTRTFCGTCNRLRVTPQGGLQTCLYGGPVLNFKDLMRSGATDAALVAALHQAVGSRAKDGFEAEKQLQSTEQLAHSMATIGG